MGMAPGGELSTDVHSSQERLASAASAALQFGLFMLHTAPGTREQDDYGERQPLEAVLPTFLKAWLKQVPGDVSRIMLCGPRREKTALGMPTGLFLLSAASFAAFRHCLLRHADRSPACPHVPGAAGGPHVDQVHAR